jgi:hypothetical protein
VTQYSDFLRGCEVREEGRRGDSRRGEERVVHTAIVRAQLRRSLLSVLHDKDKER